MSKMDFSVNNSPLKTIVSRKIALFSDISAVDIIVEWNLFNKKFYVFSVTVPRDKTSSM